jgi:transcriptional regulator with XRE-family HTH domain
MNPIMNLRKQLAHYLGVTGLTASALARKAKVPKQSLSGWLAGSNPRNIVQIKRVADALGVSLDELVFGEGPKPKVVLNAVEGNEWITGHYEVRLRRIGQ